MPFDAATTPAEVLVIDKVLEIFGPNGEYWTQRESNDGNAIAASWAQ